MRKYLVGVIALLALTLTSLGLAAGSPSTVGNGPSVVVSPDTPTASGRCSKAEGIAAVKRLGLRDVSATYPVWKVLCGAFAGTGSKTMVASISGLENVGMLYWAVFQWTGSEWQFLMKQRHAAILTAVGSDIRETWSIYRPSDSRCCPSGGTKARIWHWNGTRLVAGPWKLTPAKLRLDNFLSPDRKVWCRIFKDLLEARAWCVSTDPEHSASLKRTGEVTICNGYCTQNWDRGAPVLRYGQQTEFNGFRCTSETKGITCTVIRSGKGFLINRAGVSRVGP